MATPVLQRNAATRDFLFENVGEEVVLRLQSLPWEPFMFGIHVVQADSAYTVEVMGPLGTFAPYPSVDNTCTVGAAANGIFLVSGKWEQIKIKRTTPASAVIDAASDGDALPQATINVDDTTAFSATGTIRVTTVADGVQYLTYTGKTATTFTGVTGGTGELTTGDAVLQVGSVAVRADLAFEAFRH